MTRAPGSTVQSNGSTVCMIGGSGNYLAQLALTKTSPDTDAITSMGTMPYSIASLLDSLVGMGPARNNRSAGAEAARPMPVTTRASQADAEIVGSGPDPRC